jgi:hypothetical protein
VSSAYLQRHSLTQQAHLTRYQVTFKPKQESYTQFMSGFLEAFDAANRRNRVEVVRSLDRMEAAYFAFEPFLEPTQRQAVWDHFQEFGRFVFIVVNEPPESINTQKNADILIGFRNLYRDQLYDALFKE